MGKIHYTPTKDRQLRLVPRDDKKNLFVRLSPTTARDLKALAASNGQNSNIQECNERCWTVYGQDSEDFLPLSISVCDQIIYTSYNGGEFEGSDAIEVPWSLLADFPRLPSEVTVRVLPFVRHCTRVKVEPASVEDWELMEVHARGLELGGLLQQVSVVFSGQHLTLCLNRDLIQVLVKETSTNTEEESFWPPSTDMILTEPYAMLVQNTEVIVTPKPRPATEPPMGWSSPLRLIPCQADLSDEMLQLATKLANFPPLVVPPGCILVNESSWVSDSRWAKITASDTRQGRIQLLVRVKTSPSVPENKTAIHSFIRLQLGLALYWDSICLKATSTPSEIPLERIAIQKVLLASAKNVPAWRRPDILPAPRTTNAAYNFGFLQGNKTKWVMPVCSIFPASFLLGKTESDSMFRIVDSMEHRGEGAAISLDQQDGNFLLKRYLDDIVANNETCDNVETLHQAETDALVNYVPEVVSCTNWINPLLEDMENTKSMLVTMCGPTGIGKTQAALLLSAMARLKQHRATLYIDCNRLQESTSRMLDILAELDAFFEQCVKAKSCLIVLDDLDRLTPNLFGGDDDDPASRVHSTNPVAINQSKLICDRVLQLMEAANAKSHKGDSSGLTVVITCPSMESLNNSLDQSSSFFRRTINIPVLSSKERVAVLVKRIECHSTQPVDWDYTALGQRTENCRPRDLEKIASRVQQKMCSVLGEMSMESVLDAVLKNYVPLSHIYVSPPKTETWPTWSDIGGLFWVKSKLDSSIFHPSRYRLVYNQAGIRLPRGVLLFGPGGCGKSAIVPALARKCNFPVIACNGPEVLDKFIGASEAKVRELFNRARSVAPSILFFDELDALAPRRGSDHTGVTDRVVNQLLTLLDGVEDSSPAMVYIIGATSRPDKVDPALLRPGRLEQHLFVGPPKSDEEWADVFSIIAKGWNLSAECRESITSGAKNKDLLRFVAGNLRFSPADIRAAFDTAHVSAVHRSLKSAQPEEIDMVEITNEDLNWALQKTRPCLNTEDARMLEAVYRPFRKTVEGASDSIGNDTRRLKTALR